MKAVNLDFYLLLGQEQEGLDAENAAHSENPLPTGLALILKPKAGYAHATQL